MSLHFLFGRHLHSLIPRGAAVLLVALAWSSLAWGAPSHSSKDPNYFLHQSCGDWQKEMSNDVANCVLRTFFTCAYHVPTQFELDPRGNYRVYAACRSKKPQDQNLKDFIAYDESGYVFVRVTEQYDDISSTMLRYHFVRDKQVEVRFADVGQIKVSQQVITLWSATEQLDYFWVQDKKIRSDLVLALHTLFPNAKWAKR